MFRSASTPSLHDSRSEHPIHEPSRAARGAGVVLLASATFFLTSLSIQVERSALADEPRSTAASAPDDTSPTESPRDEIEWEPYTGQTWSGRPIEGELAYVEVPENRTRPDGPKIEIAIVRYRAKNADAGPPIFYLAGGPGGSGVKACSRLATHPALDLLAHGDVIGIDQRGVGLTRPNLFEGPEFTYELPLDRVVPAAEFRSAYAEAVARCAAYWKERGIDLSAYDTVASADDLEAVRRALGAESIVLYGASYGTHLGLAYLRRHGQHVARALLSRVEGPDHTWKLPSTVQRQLEALSSLVAADPAVGKDMPDLTGSIHKLLDGLAKEPKKVTVRAGTPDETTITIGPYDLQLVLSRFLGGFRELQTIPAAVHQIGEGNWQMLAPLAIRNRRDRIEGAMPIWMDCASAATEARRQRIEREAADPTNLLGDAINDPYHPSICASCGDVALDDAFRQPFECDVPVLFVSGELDARTPPDNVDDLADGFENHAHVRLTHTTHDARELSSRAYREVVRAFLRGDTVSSRTIELPRLTFHPVDTDMTGGR